MNGLFDHGEASLILTLRSTLHFHKRLIQFYAHFEIHLHTNKRIFLAPQPFY